MLPSFEKEEKRGNFFFSFAGIKMAENMSTKEIDSISMTKNLEVKVFGFRNSFQQQGMFK